MPRPTCATGAADGQIDGTACRNTESAITAAAADRLNEYANGPIAAAVGGSRLGLPLHWVRFFDNVHWTVADVAAAWLAWMGVNEARRRGLRREYVARRWFAFGFGAYALGQLLWNLQVFLGWQPFPAPSDAAYILLSPCCAIGMMSFLRGRVSAPQRLAAVLDTLSLAVAIVALALVIYLPRRGDTSAVALSVMIAYPTLLLSAACVGLMMMSLLRAGRAWAAWMLVAMLAVQGGLWMEWNALTLAGALADGGVVNATFSVFTLAGGLAVSCWRVPSTASPRVDRLYEGALRILPLVVVICVTFAVTLQDTIAHLSPSARLTCDAAAVLVIVLAAARQTLLLRDRDQLMETQHRLREREEELRELNQHLEQRVSERTREAEQRNAELGTAMEQLSTARHELLRAGKLAGLGALVGGVAQEVTAALANANMVALTMPPQVESLARLQDAGGADERRRTQLAGYVASLAEAQRQLGQAIEQAQRVVTRFQQLALDQTGDRRRSFDLLATVREIVDLTRLAHRHDPVEIIVTGEPELVMDSYPGAIGQVLGQLVENAIAHGFAGHRDGTIDVRVWPSGREEVRVTVRDDGAGIAPEALPRLFAPFFPTPGEHGGNGLGLALCRQIVEGMLGGRIELFSPPEAGTTVIMTLPRRAP